MTLKHTQMTMDVIVNVGSMIQIATLLNGVAFHLLDAIQTTLLNVALTDSVYYLLKSWRYTAFQNTILEQKTHMD